MTALYYRDKDSGEYKLLGKVNSLIVYGIRLDEATTIRDEPSKIIEIGTTARKMGERRTNLNVPFSAIRKICKHYSVSCDRYGDGKWVDACHHPEMTFSGSSWGKCSMDTCPLYTERKIEKND